MAGSNHTNETTANNTTEVFNDTKEDTNKTDKEEKHFDKETKVTKVVTGVTAGSTTLTATSTSGASTSCSITITSSGGGTPSEQSEEITITGESSGFTSTEGNQTITEGGFTFKASAAKQYNNTSIWLTGSSGYIYNTTDLGVIDSITCNYKSGGSTSCAQALNFGTSAITTRTTTGVNGTTWSTSSSSSPNSYEPTGEYGFFNLTVTNNKNLQLDSIVIERHDKSSQTVTDEIIINESLSIQVGSSGEIEALTEGTATSVTWSIQSGSSYISLSNKTNDGCTVTGLAAGTAVVKATFGTASDTCTVTVTEAKPISGDSSDVDLDGGSISNSVITWKTEDDHSTVTQSKGDGTSAPSGTYISAPRVYKGNILSFTADSGYKISSISIVYVGSYKGNSMTAGIALSSDSVINNTTAVSRTWGTTDDGTHVVGSVSSSGLQTIYIQNVASSNNVQLRISSITITYVASSSSATALSWGTSFLSLITCNNGVTAPNKTKWTETQTNYNALSTTEKNKVLNASANESGTDLEKAVARYVYIVNKYKNRTDYPDYLNKASSANFMNVVNIYGIM